MKIDVVITQTIISIYNEPKVSNILFLKGGAAMRIFDNMTVGSLETILEDTLEAIARWEDRIEVITNSVVLNAYPDSNTVKLVIPYIIKERRIAGEFSKVIRQ